MSETLEVVELPGYPPVVGAALWRLEDTRRRTLRTLKDLPIGYIDHEIQRNTIGTILYHIALIELNWLYVEILEASIPNELLYLFPEDIRDKEGKLSLVLGQTLDQHLARLSTIRKTFLEKLLGMTTEEFQRKRNFPQYEVSPEWVLHHLSQHEAKHRGEIGAVITKLNNELKL
ncbi:MAG TPA: DinB family protein [Anaerolineaceae bacterium]|nr:DinB family protein [Anaerolineaceae bacterium]